MPKSWPKILEAYRACDNPDESEALYEAFLRAAVYHLYGKTSLKDIAADERKVMLQKAAGAVMHMIKGDLGREGPFLYFAAPQHRQGWAHVLGGHALEIPDYTPPEPPGAEDEFLERIGRESFADPS